MREAEEVEKREDYLESIGDVTKQKDLGGFYRHIYEQKLGEEKPEQEVTEVKAPEPADSTVPLKAVKTPQKEQKDKKDRKYRRKASTDQAKSEDEATEVTSKDKKHLQSNLDADSDFEIDSNSESENENKNESKETQNEAECTSEVKDEINGNSAETNGVEKEDTPEPKPKIDIWKKRTVGDKFDSAVERYYQRKALRESA